jgi:hypothetical protein
VQALAVGDHAVEVEHDGVKGLHGVPVSAF